VTCAQLDLSARTVPGVIVVFEVINGGTSWTDRILNVREYSAVPAIHRSCWNPPPSG
jgi:hypothetical protein